MNKSLSGSYFMDDPREAARLVAKVDPKLWATTFLAPLIDSSSAKRILDVGCGPGALASAVADTSPVVHVTGVDASAARIAEAISHDRVALTVGNAHHLDFEDESFDVVYCRFLIEYLQDKQQAINEMVRVTKPDGTILLQDLDGQLLWHHPIDSDTEQTIQRAVSALESEGFDPMVGRKLFHFCRRAGLGDIDVKIEPYHQIIGAIADPERTQWQLKLNIAKSALSRLSSSEFAEDAIQRFQAHLDSPDTITYSNLFTVTGTKPPE